MVPAVVEDVDLEAVAVTTAHLTRRAAVIQPTAPGRPVRRATPWTWLCLAVAEWLERWARVWRRRAGR